MKKILMFFAAMAVVLSSCQKSELESVSANDGKDIVLNISVSNPGADDTKARIKTGWAVNDEISIWYDTNDGATPDLVVTYNGEKWIQKEGATVSGNTPSTGTGKYAKALYNGMVKVASKDDYTYENSTLTFNIANWKFLTEVQVVVKGLTSASAGSYTLACDKFTPLAAGNGYTVGSDAITASAGTKGNAVTGISNTDGVAFVFASADYSASSTEKKDFAFTLKDNTSGSEVTKVYKPNVAIEAKTNNATIKALTIESSKFAVPAPDGFVDLGVVVNSKPLFWAKCNLGASKPEENGTYFSWGETGDGRSATTSGSGAFSTKSFNWDNDAFGENFEKVPQATACPGSVLALAYDAAYQKNNSWRMPTKEDFMELFKQCFAEWTADYDDTKVQGLIVWKAKGEDAGWFKPSTAGKGRQIKTDGTYNIAEDHTFSNVYAIASDAHIFFPAAGFGDGDTFQKGSYPFTGGNYWSTTLRTGGTNANYLNFNSNNVINPTANYPRYYGFSVRPVTTEGVAPAPTPTTTGTAKATIGGSQVDVKWIQLWENGPKFAEYNVGVTDGKAESYGGYYAWGGSQDKVDDHDTGNDVLSGDNDTATKLWGSNWRMPTKAELEALLSNCDVAWTTVNDKNGRKFTGKGAYASSSVFLPAAGNCVVGEVTSQGYGYYWSSTPNGSTNANDLSFGSGNQGVGQYDRVFGFSVRAVLAK